MNLELYLNENTKIFTTPHVSAIHFRKLMEYDQTIDYMNMSLENTDELAGFVCSVFGDQFTVDDLYEGVSSYQLMPLFLDVFSFVRNGKDPQTRNQDTEDEDDEGNVEGK